MSEGFAVSVGSADAQRLCDEWAHEVLPVELTRYQLFLIGYALSYTLPDGFSEPRDQVAADDLVDIFVLKLRRSPSPSVARHG